MEKENLHYIHRAEQSKYYTKNPIAKYLLNNFINNIFLLMEQYRNEIHSISDVGCGEGQLTSRISQLNIAPINACDLSPNSIEFARENYSHSNINYYVKSIYEIGKEEQGDLVICCDVLEHLDNPALALQKLNETTNKYCLVSVPNEPIWSILNMVRGKYWATCGSTPGHSHRWSCQDFLKLLSSYMDIAEIKKPLPWLIVFCKKRLNKKTGIHS